MYYVVSKELQHHGIKGQHWGERRYQNPDGSYTEEGKKRYGIGANGKATTEGLGQFVRDKYGSDGSLKGNLAAAKKAKAESKEYEKDYRQQMANRVKTKESKQDVHNRLREKYGDLEYQTFEQFRKDRNNGKKLLAAGVALLSVSALIAGVGVHGYNKMKENERMDKEKEAFDSYWDTIRSMNRGRDTGRSDIEWANDKYKNKPKVSVEEFQKKLKEERKKAATRQTMENWKNSDQYRQLQRQKERDEKERKKQEKQEWLKDQAERLRREAMEREENRKKNDRYWYERIHDL